MGEKKNSNNQNLKTCLILINASKWRRILSCHFLVISCHILSGFCPFRWKKKYLCWPTPHEKAVYPLEHGFFLFFFFFITFPIQFTSELTQVMTSSSVFIFSLFYFVHNIHKTARCVGKSCCWMYCNCNANNSSVYWRRIMDEWLVWLATFDRLQEILKITLNVFFLLR